VQHSDAHVIRPANAGDIALIYECQSGKHEVYRLADGTKSIARRRKGRAGVISLVEVTGAPRQPENSEPQEYTDGTSAWWQFYAPTRVINSSGFIPRERVAALLGFKLAFNFHGFGDHNSGLKRLSAEVFQNILEEFLASARQEEEERMRRLTGGFGGSGEGPIHLALKQAIAADPTATLGEPGLTFWALEFGLPSADQIDIVLKDQFGRFVAVEVEVDCAASEVVGPLQCAKYRAMMSYLFDRPLDEVRCILAAHSINRAVQERCHQHRIETVEVPRR